MADNDQNIDPKQQEFIRSMVRDVTAGTQKNLQDLAGTTAMLAQQVSALYNTNQVRPVNELAWSAAMAMLSGKSPGDVNAESVAERAYEVAVELHVRGLALVAESRKASPNSSPQGSLEHGKGSDDRREQLRSAPSNGEAPHKGA